MNAPTADDPCVQLPARPPLPAGRPIHVVQLLATGTNGGAQEHVSSLLTRIDRTRYRVQVISLSDGSTARRIQATGLPTLILDEPDDATAVGAVADHLALDPPDIVHNHMYRAELVGTRAACALSEAGFPRPYVVGTVHSSRVRGPEDREVLRRLTPHMDRLIAVSRSIVAKLEREGRSGPPVSLIYNGVDLERYDRQEPCCTLGAEYGFEPGTPLVGVVARLEVEKGHPTLLEAWPKVLERVPDARLLIVGEGSRRPELEDQARSLGLLGANRWRVEPRTGGDDQFDAIRIRDARPNDIAPAVVFTGRRDDVPAVTAALDIAVLPSYREAQGVSILEAMALGRPVIASDVGGIPEVVQHGRTGLLVPPRDPVALADAIVRLLLDHPLADVLGRAGHDLVHERFCIERMVRATETIYDEGAAQMARRRGSAAIAVR
jgi:glycosyltransferase involved in cell wall biosynthesis